MCVIGRRFNRWIRQTCDVCLATVAPLPHPLSAFRFNFTSDCAGRRDYFAKSNERYVIICGLQPNSQNSGRIFLSISPGEDQGTVPPMCADTLDTCIRRTRFSAFTVSHCSIDPCQSFLYPIVILVMYCIVGLYIILYRMRVRDDTPVLITHGIDFGEFNTTSPHLPVNSMDTLVLCR